MTVKVDLNELKKAVSWMEGNTRDVTVHVVFSPYSVDLKCFDVSGREVVITLHDVNTKSMPTIKKTEIFR